MEKEKLAEHVANNLRKRNMRYGLLVIVKKFLRE